MDKDPTQARYSKNPSLWRFVGVWVNRDWNKHLMPNLTGSLLWTTAFEQAAWQGKKCTRNSHFSPHISVSQTLFKLLKLMYG